MASCAGHKPLYCCHGIPAPARIADVEITIQRKLCVNDTPNEKETCNVLTTVLFAVDCVRRSVLPAGLVWAMGEQLGETKEQLKLKYDVSVKDHGTGRVTVTLTIADQGRLKPLTSVVLVIPTEEAYKARKAWAWLQWLRRPLCGTGHKGGGRKTGGPGSYVEGMGRASRDSTQDFDS